MTDHLRAPGVPVPPIALVMFAHVLGINLAIQSTTGFWSTDACEGSSPDETPSVVLVYGGSDKYYRTSKQDENSCN